MNKVTNTLRINIWSCETCDSYGISVGDECFYSVNPEWKFIISRIYFDGSKFFFDGIDKYGMVISDESLDGIEKTGNHYPIKRFLKGDFE